MFKRTSVLYYSLLILLNFICSHNLYARRGGTAFNPAIGASSLFLFQNSQKKRASDGLGLQEMELQFSSDVDSYFSAIFITSIAPDGTGGFGISPEEVYTETISIPNITFKIGKFKMAFGKQNRLHTHAFPFINTPYVNNKILGAEGLADVGIEISGLALFLPWFSEYNIEIMEGNNTNLFASSGNHKAVWLGHIKNLWELSDDLTFEFGLSASKGDNSKNGVTTLFGGDLTFKWKPSVGGKYHSASWTTEFISLNKTGSQTDKTSGAYTYITYQLTQRWFTKYRFDYYGFNRNNLIEKQHSFFLSFVPSEFSKIRWQYDTRSGQSLTKEKRIMMQLIVNIGAHPSHSY